MLSKLLFCFSCVVGLTHAQVSYPIPEYQDIDPSTDLTALPNNSLYLRWRQNYHIVTSNGHMNDPCGPMYDPTTNLYHIFYQSFPQHIQFGNTSWSHATSPDMVYWTDVLDWRNRSMVNVPTGPYPQYDWIGAFSGGAQPVNLRGESDGNLTLMYTGASRFPDNWKLPYKRMTEQQAIATSSDGGKTWQKYAGNPVIDDAPGGWNVTGLRDPIFNRFPELDSLLGKSGSNQWYMVLGSGIRGVGPRIPLYTAASNDLTKWQFQGALFEPGENYSFGGDVRKTGTWGYNFELANIFILNETTECGGDGKSSHWFLTMGAEGFESPDHPVNHWSLFAMGSMSARTNGSIQMNVDASGVLDWGESYAFNGFYDPVGKKQIVWAYIPDVALDENGSKAQGFWGTLGFGRELFVKVYKNVILAPGQSTVGGETWTANGDGTYTVKTLGQKPQADVLAKIPSQHTCYGNIDVEDTYQLPTDSANLYAEFTVPPIPQDSSFSVLLRASKGYEEYTNVTFFSHNSSLVIDRAQSSLLNISTPLFASYFQPFHFRHEHSHEIYTEPLQFKILIDGSLIEIFLNDRYAISARVYPSRADAKGIVFEAGHGCGKIEVKDVNVWSGLANVWPNRPVNASSPLVYDGYENTILNFPNPYVEQGVQFYAGYKRDSSVQES